MVCSSGNVCHRLSLRLRSRPLPANFLSVTGLGRAMIGLGSMLSNSGRLTGSQLAYRGSPKIRTQSTDGIGLSTRGLVWALSFGGEIIAPSPVKYLFILFLRSAFNVTTRWMQIPPEETRGIAIVACANRGCSPEAMLCRRSVCG